MTGFFIIQAKLQKKKQKKKSRNRKSENIAKRVR
jgi:hypothetical protein